MKTKTRTQEGESREGGSGKKTAAKKKTAEAHRAVEELCPPEPQTSEAFRQTFLFLFDPDDAQVFRQFVDVLQDRLLDRSTYEERHPHFSYTLAEMFAVKADLCFLAHFLREVSSERRLSDLTPTEMSLSELAEQLAPEAATLAEKLEQGIQSLISDDENEDQPHNGKR